MPQKSRFYFETHDDWRQYVTRKLGRSKSEEMEFTRAMAELSVCTSA